MQEKMALRSQLVFSIFHDALRCSYIFSVALFRSVHLADN